MIGKIPFYPDLFSRRTGRKPPFPRKGNDYRKLCDIGRSFRSDLRCGGRIGVPGGAPSGKTPGDQRPAPGSYGASDAGRWFRVNRCGLYGALGRYGSRLCAGGDTGRKTETEGRSLFPGRISDVTAVSSGDR